MVLDLVVCLLGDFMSFELAEFLERITNIIDKHRNVIIIWVTLQSQIIFEFLEFFRIWFIL